MALIERISLYQEIEAVTGNPLIVYFTSRRPNASGLIAADVVEQFIKQIQDIPENTETVDVLIESNGGDGLVVWRLISVLRTKARRIRVLIPYHAFSAATLFCLGAEEIVMGKYGCLGPTDPQITALGKDGQQKNFAFEDVLAFIAFVKNKLSLNKGEAKDLYNRFLDSVEPFALGFASRSSDLATSMGAKLLQSHSDRRYDAKAALKISSKLNKNFFNHGHPLNKDEVKEIGLNIVDPSQQLEDLMWKVHLDFEDGFANTIPFDPVSNFLQNNPPLVPGLPQQPVAHYNFDIKFASVESKNLAMEFFQTLKSTVYLNQNLDYMVANAVIKTGWRDLAI